MEFKILRKWLRPVYTVGIFQYQEEGGQWKTLCNTLEDTVRELVDKNEDGDYNDSGEGKIYGKTAIPCDRYKLVLHFWEKYGKEYPMILGVHGFSGIYIHGGVDAEDTLGCPLVGENKTVGKLQNGRYWTAVIVNLLRKARENEEESFITIKQ